MMNPPAVAPLLIESFNKCLLSPGLRKAPSYLRRALEFEGPSPGRHGIWEGMKGFWCCAYVVSSRVVLHLLHFQLPVPLSGAFQTLKNPSEGKCSVLIIVDTHHSPACVLHTPPNPVLGVSV